MAEKKKHDDWKVSDTDYRFIEDEVKLYPLYKKQLQIAIGDIVYSTPSHDDNGGGKSNLPSSPTEMKAMSLVTNARIRHLELFIEAIETSKKELDKEKREFFDRLFWNSQNSSLETVAKEFAISQATASRWKRAYLTRVAYLTGIKRVQQIG